MHRFLSSWWRPELPIDAGSLVDNQENASDRARSPTGLKLLARGLSQPTVDIIFVHGLTGDRERTWTAPNAIASWPEDLLPAEIPNARILTFGYDANVTDWRGMVSINNIANHAMNLVTALATWRERDGTNERPLIFVCHSLGGLVCQDAINTSQISPDDHLKVLAQHTVGIIFLGTPHSGSALAPWAEQLARSVGLVKQTNSQILEVLKQDSEVLARIQNSFHAFTRSVQGRDIKITTFYEELPLPGIGVVVPLASAILHGHPFIGIHDNHMGMTKFANKDDPGFIAVAGELRRWVGRIKPLNPFDGEKTAVLPRQRAGTEQNQAMTPSSLSPHLSPDENAPRGHGATARSSLHGAYSVPYNKKRCSPAAINSNIMRFLQNKLTRTLDESQERSIIYIGLLMEHADLVKIGCSRRDMGFRAHELERSSLALSQISFTWVPTSAVRRIEGLIGMELANERVPVRNNDSRLSSRETYKVALSKAKHVVDRWVRLFHPATVPSLYSQGNELHPFWLKRAQSIVSLVEDTSEYSLTSQIVRWDGMLLTSDSVSLERSLVEWIDYP
ncbi:hypothetical protein BJY04DRAFT_195344 [Aspergillus karnatakaensis]|uniref:uncharacterized protein n=1 Tax=Aspergillus karnatakaensis TaxID=1810916 RepID=UPI003CCCA1EF